MALAGYSIGLILALILYVAVSYMERDHYRHRQHLIRQKLEKLENGKRR